MREAFEKWARDEGYSEEALVRDGFGYKGPDLTSDYLLWIAAWKATLAKVLELSIEADDGTGYADSITEKIRALAKGE